MSRGTKRELCEKISPAKTQRQQRKKRGSLLIECNINYQLSIINYQLSIEKEVSRKDAKAAKKLRAQIEKNKKFKHKEHREKNYVSQRMQRKDKVKRNLRFYLHYVRDCHVVRQTPDFSQISLL